MTPFKIFGLEILIDYDETRKKAMSSIAFSNSCECSGCRNFRLAGQGKLNELCATRNFPFFKLQRLPESRLDLIGATSESEVLYSGNIDIVATLGNSKAVVPTEDEGIELNAVGEGLLLGLSRLGDSEFLQISFQCFCLWELEEDKQFGHIAKNRSKGSGLFE